MNDDEFDDLVASVPKFDRWNAEFANHPMMKGFARDKAISFVFNSNRLENTLPAGLKHSNTYKLLKDVGSYDDGVVSWNSDGDSTSDAAKRCQLVQHLKAHNHLMSLAELGPNDIMDTHRILMRGAISDCGKPILAGRARNFGVNNGVDNYMPHELVEENLEKFFAWYKSVDLASVNNIKVAYKLFWRFLKIHPFEDGNGRMARLLFSYHMTRSRTPFSVCMTSGKRRSRKHYNDAIKRQDLLYCSGNDLLTFMVYSVYLGRKNFLNLKNSLEME